MPPYRACLRRHPRRVRPATWASRRWRRLDRHRQVVLGLERKAVTDRVVL